MADETLSFEKAFERLEQILELMNGGKTQLEESLKLFEEAEKLIRTCSGRLNSAEQKIEMLIKGRNGDLQLDAEQKPRVEAYGKTAGAYASIEEPKPKVPVQPKVEVVPRAAEPRPKVQEAPSTLSMDELPF